MSCNKNTPNVNKTFIVEGKGNPGFVEHTISDSYKAIASNDMYLIWGDLTIESGSTVSNDGRVVVVNGDFNNFGSYSGTGTFELLTTDLEYILNYGNQTNGNLIYYTNSPSGWNPGDTIISISSATDNVLVTKEWVNNQLSPTAATGTFTTGSTLIGSDLYFDRTDTLSAYTVDLSPLLDDTNFYTTGSTLVGNTAYFNRTDTASAYTLDLQSIVFSGGSGNCISDLYVTNIYGCSPVTVHDPFIALSGITLSGVPTNDNTLTEIIARDTTTGELKYRDVASIISAATSQDTFVTGGTLVDKNLYLDRNDTLSAVTVNLSGLTTNAGNGLTLDGDTIKLGGTLDSDTIVNGGGNNLYFGNIATDYLDNFYLTASGNTTISSMASDFSKRAYFQTVGGGLTAPHLKAEATDFSNGENGKLYIDETLVRIEQGSTAGGYTKFEIGTGSTVFTDSTPSLAGIQYAADYSGTYTPDSLITLRDLNLATTALTDNYITGMTFNPANYQVTATRNDGFSTSPIDLSILSADVTITGGTYDIDSGVVTFTNNSGGTFDVSGFTSGMTDSYTTAATLSGNSITFDSNINGPNFYNVDLTPALSGLTNTDGNGTVANGTSVDLGGGLTQPTTISGNSQTLFLGTNSSKIGTMITWANFASVTTGGVVEDVASWTLLPRQAGIITGLSGTTELGTNDATLGQVTRFIIKHGNAVFKDSVPNSAGLKYDADYSTGYTPLSLITYKDLTGTTLSGGNGITIGASNTIDLGGTLAAGNTVLNGPSHLASSVIIGSSGALGSYQLNAQSFSLNNLTTYAGGGVGTAVNSNPGSFTITNNLLNNVGTAQFGGVIILNSVDSVANRTSQLAIEEDFVQVNATNTATSEAVTWEQTYNSFDLYARNSGATELFRLKFDRANSKASFIDSRPTTSGIEYDSDYSSGYTPDSLITLRDLNLATTGLTDYYTTGGTYNSGTESIDFSGNNVSASFSVDVSSLLDDTNTYITGFTYDGANTFTIVRNDLNQFSVTINTMTGLTVDGVFSATTISGGTLYGDGSNLTGVNPPLNTGEIFVGDTTNSAQSVEMTGDVNIDVSGVTTIQPDSVTYNKMQDVSQAAILGNESTSGGTVTEIPIVEQYLSAGVVTALLENTANWDINGNYIGTGITGTYQGQSHYDGNYWFTAVADNVWIRLIRG